MKRVPITIAVLAAFALVLSYAVTSQTQIQNSSEDEQAVRKVMAATTEAFNKHDATALAHLFAADGDQVTVLGTWFKGTAEIEKGLNGLFATRLKHERSKQEALAADAPR